MLSLVLEGTARYTGFLLAPAEGFGRGQGFFYPLGKKQSFLNAVFAYIQCLVVTSVTFSSNHSNIKKKNPKKS